tara:strand:- start:4071 stop:5351 length:1281 start_codon:yes stop_codon:yes gene_type:complete
MAIPTLTPASTTSASKLPTSGSGGDVTGSLAYGVYTSDSFINGAVDQVTYTYQKLGGEILDLELKAEQVYNAYEEAVLEYSYLLNIHQAKNIMSNVLGGTTGSFDEDGQLESGHSLLHKNINLRFLRFDFAYARRIAEGVSEETGMGGTQNVYSASFAVTAGKQDYDLQTILSGASHTNLDNGTQEPVSFAGMVKGQKVLIQKVYYRSPAASWRFYGYFGGINTTGDMSSYGQYADDSTFELIPAWQNKLQAMAYENAIYTRNSHYSYELKANKLRIYPQPVASSPSKMWVDFVIPIDTWEENNDEGSTGIEGINNMNTLPFENVPYKHINSIGKHWIRRFALALSKEMLGLTRSKFGSIPIPGADVSLNGDALLSAAKEDQQALRDELKETLEELTYGKLIEGDAAFIEQGNAVFAQVPALIYTG